MPSRDVLVTDYRGRIDRYVYAMNVIRQAPSPLIQLSVAAKIMNRSTDRVHQLIKDGRLRAFDLFGQGNPRDIHVPIDDCLALGRLDDAGRKMGDTDAVMRMRTAALKAKNRKENERTAKNLHAAAEQQQVSKKQALMPSRNGLAG